MANLAEDLLKAVNANTAETKSLKAILLRVEAKLNGETSGLEFLTKDSQSKTEDEDVPKETLTKPLAKLVVALKAHNADFDSSKLAELARNYFGNAKLKSVALAWAFVNEEPSVTKWASKKKHDNAYILAWLKRQS